MKTKQEWIFQLRKCTSRDTCDNKKADDACIKNKNDVNCISKEQKEKYFKEYLEKTSSQPSSNKE
ncbi:hypothetical protein ABPD02_004390 [Escherichia coli]|nr:hypothetical protein [Escherichia coli]